MGLLRGLARLDPNYLFWDTVRNIKDGGDIVDGIKRTVKEDLTEDNPLPPEQTLAVPNGLQKAIYTAFQEVKPLVGTEVHSDEDVKRILSLKGQIQAARNIEKGKFPEIRRLTDQIGVPVMDNGRKRKALIEPRTTTE